MKTPSINRQTAACLREIATLLAAQQANPFRINAYRHAAETLDRLEQDVAELLQARGIEGLVALPAIGEGIARSIYEFVATGRMSRLDNLKGSNDAELWLRSIPTLGRELAARIHDQLHIDSLEALENALHDGRLEQVPGLGSKRREAIADWLHSHLERQQRAPRQTHLRPSIALLLKVDNEYRLKAAAGALPKIAPRRFNPRHRAWLPILHVTHDGWHFSALFSNTARAHQLQRTDDWVVIYHYDDHHREGQHTVVTETHGSLQGARVVRGREAECRDYYASVAG